MRPARTAQLFLLAGLLLLFADTASAQYFGRNKVQYRTFKFEIQKTEHFDLYFYPEEKEAADIAGRMAERWYARLSRFFGHELRGRQPVILYAVSSHFRQTNALEGLIGEGTGGATEAFKRRIVLPMSGSLADTDHVLGHELVHAFQFDITGDDPREEIAQAPDILRYPLWFAEGMAEYLTIGPVDNQTAMWLRDSAVREKLPHIKDLEHWRYFPYRWGHAFWAYVGAKYGDRAVASLLRSAANPRTDLAGLARQLGTDPDTLTREWHEAILQRTREVAEEDPALVSQPKRVLDEASGGGRYNVGPRVSPDGRQVAFFSERDRFSIDLYLADADSGKVLRRLVRTANDPHFDSLEFLNSAGAWSPDGRTIAIAAVQGGRPVIAFVEAGSGRIAREIRLEDLDDAINPVFAPDGNSMIVSGNRGGLIDLYRVALDTGALEQLTSDPYADLEPVFTPDGASLVFVTERFSTDLSTLVAGPLRLARLDLATRAVQPISGFLRGKHLSPQVTGDGRSVIFIADPDGVSNLYRMPIDGGPIERLTSLFTGVAGITNSSPALSSSTSTGRLVFSVFENDGHAIYRLDPVDTVSLVSPEASYRAALLPGRTEAGGDVQRLITDAARGLPDAEAIPPSEPYERGLALDMISQPTVTAGVNEFGAFAVGGISAYFSDMLGDRSLGVAAQIGGNFADFGGQISYMNRRHRWNWAVAAEQWPYRFGYLSMVNPPGSDQVLVSETVERQTSRGGFALTAYPFNAATRLELTGGGRALSFTRDVRLNVYDAETGNLIERRELDRVSLAPTSYLAYGSVAFVHDTSIYGATSPIFGERYRLELGGNVGTLDYRTLLADWRRYFMPARPVTVAVRAMHFGRYGRSAERPRDCLFAPFDQLPPDCITGLTDLYLGYPELVHGYNYESFEPQECADQGVVTIQCGAFNNLIGSRLAVFNIEVRAPLAGLFSGELEYGRVPVELAAFFDAGVMWSSTESPTFAGGTREVVRSIGGAARVNVFGIFTLEVAGSHPLDRRDRKFVWQVGLRQGF